jgi:hypothetical protein
MGAQTARPPSHVDEQQKLMKGESMDKKNLEERPGREKESESPDPSATGNADALLIKGLIAALGNYLLSEQASRQPDQYGALIHELGITRRQAQRLIGAAKNVNHCNEESQLLRKALSGIPPLPEHPVVDKVIIRGKSAKLTSTVPDGECNIADKVALSPDAGEIPKVLLTYGKDVERTLRKRLAPADKKRFVAYIRNDSEHLVIYRLRRIRRRRGSQGP